MRLLTPTINAEKNIERLIRFFIVSSRLNLILPIIVSPRLGAKVRNPRLSRKVALLRPPKSPRASQKPCCLDSSSGVKTIFVRLKSEHPNRKRPPLSLQSHEHAHEYEKLLRRLK